MPAANSGSSEAITTIDAYIAGFPPAVQERLTQIRALIQKLVPTAQEAIKYRIPTFVLHENLVHFAAFKNHIGFYPTSSGIAAFQDEIAKYKWAKGSVQFPLDQILPLELIERMVKFRVAEVEAKYRAR